MKEDECKLHIVRTISVSYIVIFTMLSIVPIII